MSNDRKAIEEVISKKYPDHVNQANAAGYAALYANDCLWSPPGGPDQTTVEGIEKAIGGLFSKSTLSVKIEADEIEIFSDVAWALGTVDGVSENKETAEKSSFKFRVLWIFKKSDEDWKISRQVWNTKPV